VISGDISDDGEWLVWHRDTTGDESGTFVTAPFAGGPAEPLLEGVPVGWDGGIAVGRDRTLAAIADRAGFGLYLAEGGPARRLLHSPARSSSAGPMPSSVAGPRWRARLTRRSPPPSTASTATCSTGAAGDRRLDGLRSLTWQGRRTGPRRLRMVAAPDQRPPSGTTSGRATARDLGHRLGALRSSSWDRLTE
jgi:hypothetical protein